MMSTSTPPQQDRQDDPARPRPQAGGRIKVGLLGAGYILEAHAKSLRATPDVELAAVCDISRARAEHAARAFGIPSVFTSLAELLGSDCEVVHVLLPPQLHVETARQVLSAGKSVFLEKPMGLESTECRQLVELAHQRGLKLGVNHNFLFLPAYEKLRDDVKRGAVGRVDHLAVNWLYPLNLIQSGPFNNWMLRSPENLLFELGPHLAAFVLDLLGPLDQVTAQVTRPIDLPGRQRVFRHWSALARRGGTSVSINLSVTPGQAERSVHLRGQAATAHLDFSRGWYWQERTHSSNSVFDNALGALHAATQLLVQAAGQFGHQVAATVNKAPSNNPFQESIHRSIQAYYRSYRSERLDPRLDGSFGVQVIELCEEIARQAGVAAMGSAAPIQSGASSVAPASMPTVLVVGGTGFIGKRLVKALASRGRSVRVLSRSAVSAQMALEGIAADIVQGSYDDPQALERALDGIEVVYHLAKATGERWQDYVAGDIEPTRMLAQAALRHGVKRFIYTGTIDSYFSANAGDVIDSDTALDSQIARRNHYARSKASCEALLSRMHEEQGLPLVIFRPGVVIGAGAPPAHWGVGMFHADTRVQFWGNGLTKLPLVLVDDVAEGLALGLDAPGIEGRTFLLTSEPLLSAREYVDLVSARSGALIRAEATPTWNFFVKDVAKEGIKHLIRHPNRRTPSYRDWDCRAHRSRYDSRKTREVLGWQPVEDRDEFIRRGIYAAVDHHLR